MRAIREFPAKNGKLRKGLDDTVLPGNAEEATTNTKDMYSREKAAYERQAEIERHIQTTALLRENKPEKSPDRRKWALTLGGAALAALLIALMVIAAVSAGGFHLFM